MTRTTPLHHTKGFSMIELLVVTTIVVVLSTIALVSYNKAGQSSRNSKRKADLESVRQALVLYRTDFSAYPVGTDFTVMLSTIAAYISSDRIQDPKNDATYSYSYTSDGATFTLNANMEPDASSYPLRNP